MKSVLLGIGLMVVVSVGAWLVMDMQVTTAGDAFTSPNNSVRLD